MTATEVISSIERLAGHMRRHPHMSDHGRAFFVEELCLIAEKIEAEGIDHGHHAVPAASGIEGVEKAMKSVKGDWLFVSLADLTEIFQRLNHYGKGIGNLNKLLGEAERARDDAILARNAAESKLGAAESLIGSLRDELVSLRARKRPLDTVATAEYVTREMFDRLGKFTHRLCSRIEKLEAAQQQPLDAAVRTNP